MPSVQLDHIVLHLPYADIVNPPSWLTSSFTISPGGRHGDGLTENKLIVFRDGTYIELIAFVTPEARTGHFWGDKGYGIIDYALTLKEGSDAFEDLRSRINAVPAPDAWKLQPMKSGSRKSLNGDEIRWHVSFPAAGQRGHVPFWCFDVTPREHRVPADESLTSHPCGAQGVGSLTIFTDASLEYDKAAMLDAIFAPPQEGRDDDRAWDLATPKKIAAQVPCQLSVMPARGQYEKGAVQAGRNLVARVALFTDDEPDAIPNISQVVEGDDIRIGFFKA